MHPLNNSHFRRIGLSLCLLLLLPLTGCMHAIRLKDRAIVQAVGIDWKDERYQLTFQYFVPEGSGGQTAFDASKLNNNIIRSSGSTITEAVSQAGRDQGRQLFFGSNRIVVLGREMAKRDIETPVRYFNTQQQVSPGIYLMVAQKSAEEIVSAQIARGIVPASAIEQAAERGRSSRFLHGGRLIDIVMQLQGDAAAADLPLISLSGEEEQPQIVISGSALCREGKLIDTLSEEEVLGVLWITGWMEQGSMSFPLTEDTLCALKILGSNASLRPFIDKNGQLTMEIKISVHSAIQETVGASLPISEALRLASQEQEKEIRRLAMRAIEKTVTQNEADILGLYKALRKYEPEYYRAHRQQLPQLLQNMHFDLKITCNIGRMGLEAGEEKR